MIVEKLKLKVKVHCSYWRYYNALKRTCYYALKRYCHNNISFHKLQLAIYTKNIFVIAEQIGGKELLYGQLVL